MGLSIHYTGSILKKEFLPEMIIEIKEIAEHYGWKYKILNEIFPEITFDENDIEQPFYGIIVNPPGSEPLWFTFMSNGKMSNPSSYEFWVNEEDSEKRKYLYMLFTKTQYAGVEAHQKIILLFKHISKKYLKDFNLNDESEYWETGDEKLMFLNFKKYDMLIENFALALESIPKDDVENLEEYLTRVFSRVNDDFNTKFGG